MLKPLFSRGPLALAVGLSAAIAVVPSGDLAARPVSYAGGHMLMVDHQPDMDLYSYTYSPSFRWSASLGALRVDDLSRTGSLDLNYVRGARLLKRWNLPSAQANAFGWAGVGEARTDLGSGLARHAGLQLDYETRRIYTSVMSELHEGPGWSHRFDTAAIGWAPYAHDVDRIATWFVLKGSQTTNALESDVQPTLVLRLFTTRWWLEVGANGDGEPVANLMLNL